MANKKLETNLVSSQKEIRYLNKTFPQYRQSLIDFARQYFPDTYNDFNESSPGMMFIEMASYVGDVLGYYIDAQFRENLLQYAQEQDNIISIAQSLGYRPKPTAAAVGFIDVYQLCPAGDVLDDYRPDSKYFLRIQPNMVVRSPEYDSEFRTIDVIDFGDPTDREITVYSVDGINKPQTYLIRKRIRIVAGTIKTVQQSFGSAKRFSKITLPDQNVLEIMKVVDGSGNKWYEVDYLAQDLILEDRINTRIANPNEGVAPFYIMKVKRTPRRFVARYNSDFFMELHFGSGIIDDSDNSINLEPKKIYNDEYELNLASTSLDPSDFLSSRSYGLSPANTELTITYTTGGGLESNVPTRAITQIRTVDFFNDLTGMTPAEQALMQSVIESLSITNTEPATGGKDADSIEEIRQNAMAFFNAQNRLVTPEDYTVRCYAMPPKYGGIAKAFVVRDEQITDILRNDNSLAPADGMFVDNRASQNIVNLYVLGYDKDKKITRLNMDTKKNLKTYLENYRILTDEIRILDGFIVNIGVNFEVVVYRSYNMNEVLVRCIDEIKNFFDISGWQMNQPIIMNDLLLAVAQVEGVQSVTKLEIFNRYGFKDGLDYESFIYDIKDATEAGIIWPSIDPCIFEIRHPERDIIGSAVQ